jgi:hypothetical protein
VNRRALAGSALLLAGCGEAEPPYPPSERLVSLELDFDRLVQAAPGSDNWALTWGADDAQYAVFGDGGGFGGTDDDGRASLGVARIEGEPNDLRAVNLWGGKDAPSAATFDGKSYGILSIGGTLYLWVGPGSGVESYAEARLAVSRDAGRTWERARWAFPEETRLAMPTFVQFGRDHDGARDGFAYAYFVRRVHRGDRLAVHRPGEIDLARAPAERLLEEDAWEFFAGAEGGDPAWTRDASRRAAVFRDPNGVGWCVSAAFLPGPGRYLLATEHGRSFRGNFGLFEAEEPWGPWRTVLYEERWGEPRVVAKSFFWNFSPKWSAGGDVVLVFTGIEELDCWNSVPGRFVLADR